ncbi:glycosyltransferase [Candidatus Berkiella aquae]|nr:glycosyltransferase family 1 protein [Candidatus Berkiella aquae]MCS5712312.1 glycosyltransferase family 4 protein [Candidatus Berkiella aquae]
MKKKKVGLYLDAGPACGGTYQYNHLMLEALMQLPASEYEPVVFYGSPHWQSLLEKNQIRGQLIQVPKIWQKMAGLWRRLKFPLSFWHHFAKWGHPLARAMLKEQCSLWIFPSQDAYAYLMPVPSLAAVHDLMHRYETRFPEVGAKKEYARREYHYQNTCKWAKGILVDSPLGKEQAMESYQITANACHVLPYIANRYIVQIRPSIDFDQKYSLPKKYLFYPAQFWQHKNHENLLKAVAICRQTIPDIQLVLVGSPKNHYQQVIELIKELKLEANVHILGLVDEQDIPEFYRRARALIMPTFFGPTNIPPLEAFALECPVAISDIYGMKSQLGDAALFFNPLDVKQISETINLLWLDDSLGAELKNKGKTHHENKGFSQFNVHFQKIMEDVLFKKYRT